MTKKFKAIRKEIEEEAPVNATGPAVATDVPIVRKNKPIIFKRKALEDVK